MPVTTNKDEQGCYAQYGSQTKYYYACGNEEERKAAMQKAMVQGIAIHREEGKLKREEKHIKIKAEQTKRADEVRAQIKSEKDKSNKHNKK